MVRDPALGASDLSLRRRAREAGEACLSQGLTLYCIGCVPCGLFGAAIGHFAVFHSLVAIVGLGRLGHFAPSAYRRSLL